MSRRADAIQQLARLLSDEAGVAVEADWTGSGNRWVISWCDGPTADVMLLRAGELIEQLKLGEAAMRPGRANRLDPATLQWFRSVSMRTVALALLDRYCDGRLPADRSTWPIAAGRIEDELRAAVPYPEHRDPAALAAGQRLAELADGYPHRMGELLATTTPAELGIDLPALGEPTDADHDDLRGLWVWGAWPSDRVTIIERRPRQASATG